MYRLVVEGGRYDGRKIRLPLQGRILVGREKDCQLRLASTAVSRHHCQFELDGPAIRIRDLGSNNGTKVNAERIEGVTVLKPGDRIEIGPIRLRVELIPRTGPMMAQPPASVTGTAEKRPSGTDRGSATGDSAIDDDAIAGWLSDGDSSSDRDTEILPSQPHVPVRKKFRSIAEEGDEIIRRYLEKTGQPHPDDVDATP
ncbi:MAG: FHA domain-containing protein [Planctomycetota bacterium]|nr:MAG: FHA domain-containing protein [Planctomycetota bacterium]